MGRRSDHSKQELKALALDESRKIIQEEGYLSLSTRKIAKSMGYSPGTLYNLFKNFDNLILQINAKTLDQLDEHLQIEMTSSKDVIEVGMNLAYRYFDFARKQLPFWKMLFEFRALQMKNYPDWYQSKIDRIFDRIEKILLPHISKGGGSAIKVLWAGVHGICELSLNDKLKALKTITAEEMAESLFKNYLKGFFSDN